MRSSKATTKKASFNSTKVRLRQTCGQLDLVILEFQFHKGSIKTSFTVPQFASVAGFQFHKGSIKTFGGRMQEELEIVSIPQRFD